MNNKYEILSKYFGHTSFRQGQEELIDSLLDGKDVLGVMPTGAGKSMCYQIPAMIFPGVTFVISPLISLMHDQVVTLVQSGIPAAYINSSLTYPQYLKVTDRLRRGEYKLVYVAPERLEREDFLNIAASLCVPLIAIDEAHCVSQWGQDFRPGYLKIADFIESFQTRPTIGAFTATATDNVRSDIIKLLKMNNPISITTGFDRPNLFFSVAEPPSKEAKLLAFIKERPLLTGIVYCSTRNNVEEVCDMLNENGCHAVRYHAGLSEEERRRNQEAFVYDRVQVMVATNAFGMGIDKSNVSYVVHYNMPKDLESYYQEAGRAGRDGGEAECLLLYSPHDVRIANFLIDNSDSRQEYSLKEQEELRQRDKIRLKYMTYYCTTPDCLRGYMLRYFGERRTGSCGKCSNCLSNYTEEDITVDAQKILSCIVRMRRGYGVKMVCDVLRGNTNERIRQMEFDKLSTYGLMKGYSESRVRSIIGALITNGILAQTDGDYPTLTLTQKSAQVLKGELTVKTRVIKRSERKAKTKTAVTENPDLYEKLRQLRKTIADAESVPAYVVFSDAVLRDIAANKPKNKKEFSAINGVGYKKLEKYSDRFIEEIIKYESNT